MSGAVTPRPLSLLSLVWLLGVALVAAMAVPPQGPASAAEPETGAPAEAFDQPSEGRPVDGSMAPAPALVAQIQQSTPARVGGKGQVQVSVVRRSPNGRTLHDVTVDIRDRSRAGRIVASHGNGWRCETRRGQASCVMKRLAAGTSPGALFADVKVTGRVPSGVLSVSTNVSWAKAKAASSKRKAQGSAKPISPVRDSGVLEVYPRLRASLTSPQGRDLVAFSGGGPQSRESSLAARVSGISGGQVTASWRQLSGPRVRFLQPKTVSGVQEQLGQTFVTPKSLRGTKNLRFALTLRANGATVRKTIGLRVTGRSLLGEVDPRYGQLAKLAKASNSPDQVEGLAESGKDLVKVSVGPRNTVAPGATVKLTVKPVRKIRAQVASVSWFSGTGTQDTDTGLRGRTVTLAAPKTPGASEVITAVVRLRNGADIQSAEIIAAKTPQPRLLTAEASAANIKTFCSVLETATRKKTQDLTLLTDGRKVSPKTLQSLVLNNTKATWDESAFDGKKCTGKGTFTFEDATLEQPNGEITDVKGKITAEDGLSFDSGVWHPSKGFLDGAPPNFLKTWKVEGNVKSKLSDGKWTPLAGAMTIPGKILGPLDFSKMALIPIPIGDQTWHIGKIGIQFLNSDPKDPDVLLRDGTLRLEQEFTGPNEASIKLAGDSYLDKVDTVHVAVANIQLAKTSKGDTWQASGTADVRRDKSDWKIELAVKCANGTDLVQDCELFSHFAVENAKIYWTSTKFGLAANARVQYGDDRKYPFALIGSYHSAAKWDLAAQNTSPFPIKDDVTLDRMVGKLEMEPIKKKEAEEDEKSRLVGAFTGTVEGLKFGSNISPEKVTGSLTNACPIEENKPDCNEGEMRIAVDAEVRTTLPGKSDPVLLTADATVNLNTLEFTFAVGLKDVSIGPEALQIKQATFIISTGKQGLCTPKDAAAQPSVLNIGFIAEAKILGGTVTVGGGWSSGAQGEPGQCFFGSPGPMDLGESMKTSKSLITYGTYKNGTKFALPGYTEPIILGKPNVMSLSGNFAMPKVVNDFFNIPDASLTYTAELATDLTSAKFEIAYKVATGQRITVYQGDSSNFGLTEVGFGVAWLKRGTKAEVELSAFADGALFIKGNPDQGIPDSDTPLGVSLAFGFKEGEVSMSLQVGVNTQDKPIENAFGQAGLTVRNLAFKASLKLPSVTPEIAFNGDADLPTSWTSGSGMKTQKAVLGFVLAKVDPCLKFELGDETAKPTDPAIIDIGGVVTANYLKLLIAPTGCTLPVGGRGEERLEPGFGFAFVGTVVGSKLDVVLNVGFQGGFKMKGHVKTDKFDLYAIALSSYDGKNGPDIEFDIDSAAKKYDITIDAAIEIGKVQYRIGGIVKVQGKVSTSGDYYDVDLVATGSKIVLGPISVNVDRLSAKVHWAKKDENKSKSYANVDAALHVNALGLHIGADGSLVYKNSQLEKLNVGVETGMDVGVLAVKGRVAFNYCLGTLTLDRSKGESTCAPFAGYVDASPAYRLSLIGKARVLWWEDAYTWVAYDQEGKEGSVPPPAPDQEPEYIPGPTPDVNPKQMSVGMLKRFNDAVSGSEGNMDGYTWKAVRPIEVQTQVNRNGRPQWDKYPPCDVVALGTQWNPTDGGNPAPVPANPSTRACGLKADVLTPAATSVGSYELICEATRCFRPSLYADRVNPTIATDLGALDFRNRIIQGLRTPPGVIPAGASLSEASDSALLSPDGRYKLDFGQKGFSLSQDGKKIWSAEKNFNKWLNYWELTKEGQLVADRRFYASDNAIIAGIKSGRTPTDPSDAPYLFVQDGLVSYEGKNNKLIWGVNELGNCLPAKESCSFVAKGLFS